MIAEAIANCMVRPPHICAISGTNPFSGIQRIALVTIGCRARHSTKLFQLTYRNYPRSRCICLCSERAQTGCNRSNRWNSTPSGHVTGLSQLPCNGTALPRDNLSMLGVALQLPLTNGTPRPNWSNNPMMIGPGWGLLNGQLLNCRSWLRLANVER